MFSFGQILADEEEGEPLDEDVGVTVALCGAVFLASAIEYP